MIQESSLAFRRSSRRTARNADDQRMAALCHRRASKWAEAIREGLDPDIARFIQDQAAAWRLVAANYARSAEQTPDAEGSPSPQQDRF
jgi:hypothetical protein